MFKPTQSTPSLITWVAAFAIAMSSGCGARAISDELDFPTTSGSPNSSANQPADVELPIPAPTSCEALGWVNFEVRDISGSKLYFEFCGPEELRKHKVQGIDSFVGAFISDTMRIDFDLGIWSDPLTELDDQAQFNLDSTIIDGRTARLVSCLYNGQTQSGHAYIAAAHFPRIHDTYPETKLTLWVEGASTTEQDTALALFKTVRFHDSPY
jgi:hypothetical protein